MNVVNLIGNITKDPELKSSSNGKPFVAFTLAVNEYFDGKQNTHFISCFAWNKVAENMNKYVKKGYKLAVEGSLNVIKNNNSSDQYSTQTIVQVSRVEFLNTIKSADNQDYSNQQQSQSNNSNYDYDIIDNNNNSSKSKDIDDAILWED